MPDVTPDPEALGIADDAAGPDDKPTIRVAGLLIHEGSILMVEQGRGDERYWLLPGGGVQFGETLSDALRRELQEELGLRVGVQRLRRHRRVDLTGAGLREARRAPDLRDLRAGGGDCRSHRTSRSSSARFLDEFQLQSADVRPPITRVPERLREGDALVAAVSRASLVDRFRAFPFKTGKNAPVVLLR